MTIPPHSIFSHMPDAFLSTFGKPCEVAIGGVVKSVRGILRGPHGAVAAEQGYGEDGVNGMTPTASFAAEDVAGIKDGDTVTFAGVTWKIREPLPDGRGMVRCELERA